jgi:hypothetical protein
MSVIRIDLKMAVYGQWSAHLSFFSFFALCFKLRLALVIISSVFTLDYVNPTPKQFRFF